MPGNRTIFSIGHSNRTIEAFLELLEENEIELVADVRTVPKSRTNPQFNKETLAVTLKAHSIEYIHLPTLGGLRGKKKESAPSHNTAWENSSFLNYADYAETEPFRAGLRELSLIANEKRTAYMCAEAVWWRCHRRIITDYLLSQGWDVQHVMGHGKTDEAEINANAVVQEDGRITYPGEQAELDFGI